jgi:hypothetical protein
MKLLGKLVPVAAVSLRQRSQMYELMDRNYENVSPEVFAADLAEKRWVILLLDSITRDVCGFSTQRLLTAEVEGHPVTALFSGDTIVARERWGDSTLAHVWGQLALSLIDADPERPLYWLLISKGYKTYRFLPLFFREFYPRYDRPTPVSVKAVVDALAITRWREAYDSAAGVIHATPFKDRLRPGVADINQERMRDPHVRFFLDRNPEHAHGAELCCLAPLSRENFTAAAWRVIGAAPVATEVA